MNAVLYLRVSTEDQDATNQALQLRQWAESKGHTITQTYQDTGSGKKSHHERAALYQLLSDIKEPHRRPQLVCFWALDRLTREGVFKTLQYLDVFKRYDVLYHSYTEPYISTLGPFADVVISVLGALAKMEREKISERTKAGLEKATRQGKRLGRPQTAMLRCQEVWALFLTGLNAKDIARQIGIGETSVRRILKTTEPL